MSTIPIIDPLKNKLRQLLYDGCLSPLDKARLEFGTENDAIALINEFSEKALYGRNHAYIDLTPFERLGHLSRLVDGLKSHSGRYPVLMVIEGTLCSKLIDCLETTNLFVVEFAESGDFKKTHYGARADDRIRKIIERELNIGPTASLRTFRKPITQIILQNLINESLAAEYANESINESLAIEYANEPKCVRKYGRMYRQMPNGMLISCYLNLKKLGYDVKHLVDLAYEVVLFLSEFFRRDRNPLLSFQYIVVPNNTALFLVATLQTIMCKPIVVVDRLGPIPSTSLPTSMLAKQLAMKNVVLLEEVVATGSEVDRSLLYLTGILGAKVNYVIALYNLDVGMPLLAADGQLISLCYPKEAIGYEYRSQ